MKESLYNNVKLDEEALLILLFYKLQSIYFTKNINVLEIQSLQILLNIIGLMKVLYCISNPPTKQFYWTRHNIGRLFASQYLIRKHPHIVTKHDLYQEYRLKSFPKLIVCLSETYMNLSGKGVAAFFRRNSECSKQNLLVAHDDLEHKFGNIRIKNGGSAQGHNGIISISGVLGKDFRRLHLGIDRPTSRDPEQVANYVLSSFSKKQKEFLEGFFAKTEEFLKKDGFM